MSEKKQLDILEGAGLSPMQAAALMRVAAAVPNLPTDLLNWAEDKEAELMAMDNSAESILARKFFRPWLWAWRQGARFDGYGLEDAPVVWPVLVATFVATVAKERVINGR